MIRQRTDRDGLQVQVYAGRDPLTGRKPYVSRQVPGSGRAALKQAKQVEAQLLVEVAAGRRQGSAMTLAQLLDEWLAWRESMDRYYAALRKAGNARTGGGALSASRVREVHAICRALGLAARWG